MSKFCTKCGNELRDDDFFCAKCGAKFITETSAHISPKASRQVNKKAIIITLVATIVVCSVFAVVATILKNSDEKEFPINEYINNVNNTNKAFNIYAFKTEYIIILLTT